MFQVKKIFNNNIVLVEDNKHAEFILLTVLLFKRN
ncbi:hypothetical protein IV487_11410 [Enterococcus saccharolyticus]|nr:hypothetical protein [Enterococcus saccharolyticus]